MSDIPLWSDAGEYWPSPLRDFETFCEPPGSKRCAVKRTCHEEAVVVHSLIDAVDCPTSPGRIAREQIRWAQN